MVYFIGDQKNVKSSFLKLVFYPPIYAFFNGWLSRARREYGRARVYNNIYKYIINLN